LATRVRRRRRDREPTFDFVGDRAKFGGGGTGHLLRLLAGVVAHPTKRLCRLLAQADLPQAIEQIGVFLGHDLPPDVA
jgi:hypothetical protein